MPAGTTPRAIALDILITSEQGRCYATELLDRELTQAGPDARDSALITELVYGTIRMRGAIDWLISKCSSRPVEKINLRPLMCLRLAIYQLVYLDRIPEYAAVNESVELAKAKGSSRVSAFVNAVLRKFLSNKDRITFPSKEDDLIRHISVVHSHPRFLVERWVKYYGVKQTEEICRINNIPAPLFVRTNTLKTSRAELIEILKSEGCDAQPVEANLLAIRLTGCSTPSSLPSFKQGMFYVQDISAMKAVKALKPQQNENVLDMCAAPGGKTTFLAQQMQKHGTVVACDSDRVRMKKLNQNLRRLEIPNVTVLHLDAAELPKKYPKSHFDRVLVDVPCTNTGVLRRRAEARWRLAETNFEHLPKIQRNLLGIGSRMVKKGGVLVYSTCSIDLAENSEVVKDFLDSRPDIRMNHEEEFLPEENGGDGGYIARFTKL